MEASSVRQADNCTRLLQLFEKSNIVFLTGPGGTGKTYTINQLCEQLKGLNIARTATTGLAATHISGNTIHRFAGIGINSNPESLGKIMSGGYWGFTQRRLQAVSMVIIDEISMLRGDTLTLIDHVFRAARMCDEPFGGVKVLFSGDFLQLPPVDKKDTQGLLDDLFGSPWAFESSAWINAGVETLYLNEIKRQDNDGFINALMQIRKGRCPDWVDDMMRAREGIKLSSDIRPTKFVATNAEAERINKSEIQNIDGDSADFEARISTDYPNVYKQIMRDSLVPKSLHLKEGSQVMFLKNDKDGAYVNGSLGIVKEFVSGGVKVETTDGEEVVVRHHVWERLNHKDEVVGSLTQIPLKPAYAITIHKSQGMTLDQAEIDCSRIFAPGQAYVALSRVASLEGLRLKNWNRKCVFADKSALSFYEG